MREKNVVSLQHLIQNNMDAVTNLKVEFKPVGLSLETDKEHFALALKTWRLRHRLTQRQAGERCGVSRYSIMRAEAGKEPSWEVLYRIMCGMAEDLR